MTRDRGAHTLSAIVFACLFVHMSATPTSKDQLIQDSKMARFPSTSLNKSAFAEFQEASPKKSLDMTASSPPTVSELWSLGGRHDLMKQVIKPEAMQPFYFIPISNSVKVLLQFKMMGIDLATMPRKPGQLHHGRLAFGASWPPRLELAVRQTRGGASAGGIKKIGKYGSQAAFIGMALNGYKHDLQAWWYVGERLNVTDPVTGKSLNTWMNRQVVRSLIWASSSNLPAAIAIWCSLRSQGPAEALKLKPRYAAVDLSGTPLEALGFPLDPFGASWLSPLKWLYAVLLAPYILPGVLFWSLLTCIEFIPICCHSPGCCMWFLKGYLSCLAASFVGSWNIIKCTFWSVVCLVALFRWSLLQDMLGHLLDLLGLPHHPRSAWWSGYGTFTLAMTYFFLVVAWEMLLRKLVLLLYAAPSPMGLCRSSKAARVRDPLLPQTEPAQSPCQVAMEALAAVENDAANTDPKSGIAQLCPIVPDPFTINAHAREIFTIFNAEELQKDFDIDPVFIQAQRQIFDTASEKGCCGTKVSKTKLILETVVGEIGMNAITKAKVAILASVLKYTNTTMMLQIFFFMLAHCVFNEVLFFDHQKSPWYPYGLLRLATKSIEETLSERHFTTYFSSVLHAAPQELSGFLLKWWRLI